VLSTLEQKVAVWEGVKSPGHSHSPAFQTLVSFTLPVIFPEGEIENVSGMFWKHPQGKFCPTGFSQAGVPPVRKMLGSGEISTAFSFQSLPAAGLSEK